jgi:hypothetical protein
MSGNIWSRGYFNREKQSPKHLQFLRTKLSHFTHAPSRSFHPHQLHTHAALAFVVIVVNDCLLLASFSSVAWVLNSPRCRHQDRSAAWLGGDQYDARARGAKSGGGAPTGWPQTRATDTMKMLGMTDEV